MTACATERREPAAKARVYEEGFNRRGVVIAASHAYIRASLGNALMAAGQGP